MKLVSLLALLALTGCATNSGRAYPIIGFGWITVKTNQPTVFTWKAIGLNTGNNQISLGLSSFTVVTVPTSANVIIELKK